MSHFSLPYGKSQLSFQIPEAFNADELTPNPVQPAANSEEAILKALSNPIGKRKLQSFNDPSSIGIAINDKTRPVPQLNPVDLLLNYLESLGFDREIITLYIASGTHAPMHESDFPVILSSEIIKKYRVVVHDCDQSPMVDLGETPHHTPIRLNAAFFQSDIKITVGNIEPHHFMGFSGGVKTAVIGLASRETINANHALLSHPQAKSGVFYINPMRQDIEEMGKRAGIDFTLGTILDDRKRILRTYFGDPTNVMKEAIPVVQEIFGVSVPQPYDLVIASSGGDPKDINLYQAQKGLTHAARITRDGGWVILLAACPEGSGSPSYEEFIKGAESNQAIITQFQNGFFQVGPHKAFQIAREAVRVNIVLVSDIPSQRVKKWKLTPSKPELLQQLIHWIAARLSQNARVAVLPDASRTMTEVKHGGT